MAINWSSVCAAAVGALVLGLALAWLLAVRNLPAARIAAILLLPLFAIPPIVFAALRWPAAVLPAAVLSGLPFVAWISGRKFRDVERAYGNAARSHGASEWHIFWRVLLPLSWQTVAIAAALAFARIAAESAIAARL